MKNQAMASVVGKVERKVWIAYSVSVHFHRQFFRHLPSLVCLNVSSVFWNSPFTFRSQLYVRNTCRGSLSLNQVQYFLVRLNL